MATSHRAAALVSSLVLSALLGCRGSDESDSGLVVIGGQVAPEQQLSLSLKPRVLSPESPSGAPDAADFSPKRNDSADAHGALCVQGWSVPRRGSPLRKAALDMIRERPSERFVVVDLRYFRGPEDAEALGPAREVERWYVKAYSVSRHPRRQRWLVRRAAVGSGIDAVAPFDSTGYGPGTWRRPDAVDESLTDPFQRPCDRVGEKCLGLPRQVLGCLKGT